MGASVSKAANDVGSVIGNALAAPLKSIFGRSCEDVCAGIWDVVCFIEHICVPDLIKFLLVCGLCYICLVFLYLLFKLGVCQCAVRSLWKICCSACETYCLTLDFICCFCWRKIRYTKRVYRGRHRHLRRQLSRDVELGYNSTSDEGKNVLRKRKNRHYKNVRLKKGQVSVHLGGRSRGGRRRRNKFKHLHMSKFKRRRLDVP